MKWFIIKYLQKLFSILSIGPKCGHFFQCRNIMYGWCSYIDYCCGLSKGPPMLQPSELVLEMMLKRKE